jgi:hypothetical protein
MHGTHVEAQSSHPVGELLVGRDEVALGVALVPEERRPVALDAVTVDAGRRPPHRAAERPLRAASLGLLLLFSLLVFKVTGRDVLEDDVHGEVRGHVLDSLSGVPVQ